MSLELEDGTLRIQQIIAAADAEIKSTQVAKDIDLEIDPGNLTVVDVNFLDDNNLRNKRTIDDVLLPIGRDSIQLLMESVYNLQRKNVDNIPFAILPPPTTILPREKPVPKEKALTKWEKYAKDKGIKKKKKERKIWDATANDFIPRYGRHKVQIDKDRNWVMEVPRQSNMYEDQFKKAADAKKERIAKNEFQRLRNIARSGKNAVPGVGVMRIETTKDVTHLKGAQHHARFATASIGKFQPILKNEKNIKGYGSNARRDSDKPQNFTMDQEKKKSLKVIDRIFNPIVNTDTNIIKRIEKDLIAEEVQQRRNLKSDRRSKRGGRLNPKSGAALAGLSKGNVGDKSSIMEYRKKKQEADSGKKKKTKTKTGGKFNKKKTNSKKSLFGGTKGKKTSNVMSGGKIKKRKR